MVELTEIGVSVLVNSSKMFKVFFDCINRANRKIRAEQTWIDATLRGVNRGREEVVLCTTLFSKSGFY